MNDEIDLKEQTFLVINPNKITKSCVDVEDGGNVTEHTPKGAMAGPKTIVQFKSVELFVILERKDENDKLPCLVSVLISQPEQDVSKFCKFFKHHFERFLTNNKSSLGDNVEISNHIFAEYIYEKNYNSDMPNFRKFLHDSGLKYHEIKELQYFSS